MSLKLFRRSEFTRGPRTEPQPFISVGPRQLQLSKFFDAELGNWKVCQLWYDDEQQRIVVKLANPKDEEVVTLQRLKCGGARVTAKYFLDWAGIPHQGTQRYEATYLESRRSFICYLDKPVGTMTLPRRLREAEAQRS